MTPNKTLINPLDKVFKVMKDKVFDKSFALFETDEDSDVDLKSDVVYPEDVYISSLKVNDNFLESKGILPVYKFYLDSLLRVRFSLDRKSREEFVNINKKDHMTENLTKMSAVKNLMEARN